MSIRGWVYVIDNQAMPGLVKVGYSTKDPALRAKELAGTGVPHPFRVVFDALVEEPHVVERAVHALLASHLEGKEWFRCSEAVAVDAIRSSSKVLLERALGPLASVPSATVETGTRTPCPYFGCGVPSVSSYKGIGYCEKHYAQLRSERFLLARARRDG